MYKYFVKKYLNEESLMRAIIIFRNHRSWYL